MTAEFLSRLVNAATQSSTGLAPVVDGWFEPLAAIYPRDCLGLVQERLRSGDYAMQSFLREAIARNLITPFEVAPEDRVLFRNLNSPVDLDGR